MRGEEKLGDMERRERFVVSCDVARNICRDFSEVLCRFNALAVPGTLALFGILGLCGILDIGILRSVKYSG